MGPLIIFLLSLYHLQTTTFSELVDAQSFNPNTLLPSNEFSSLMATDDNDRSDSNNDNNDIIYDNSEELPFVKTGRDQTEVEFRHPISSVNIDYSKNIIILKFRKDHSKLTNALEQEQDEQRKSLESNFMRLGRAPADFMRFGKRQSEQLPKTNGLERYFTNEPGGLRKERSQEGVRDSRGDNFMRFGRSAQDFMRFGRTPADFMRFGKSSGDFMRFGRNPADFMRLGRTPGDNFMRFGRTQKSERDRQVDRNFMRFGRPDNFMRFGRSPPETIDSSGNFMRFGKRFEALQQKIKAAPEQLMDQKNVIHEAAKMLHATEKTTDDEANPMDKAISVLYNKHQQEQQQQQQQQEQQTDKSHEDGRDLSETEEANFDMN